MERLGLHGNLECLLMAAQLGTAVCYVCACAVCVRACVSNV